MPARLSCPDCGAVPKLADDDLPPGKKIKCRKCGTVYPVPAADDEPEVAVSPRRRPAPVVDDEDCDDDYDDRESRRPRRRRRRQESSSGLVVGVVAAVVLVVCLAIGGVGLWAAFKGKPETPVADNNPGMPQP